MNSPTTLSRSAALLLVVTCAAAWADDPVLELENMVVTAGLEPVAADEVAASMTVITARDIKNRQALFLS
ncbi:MAG: hypothetical protein HKO64_13170, partial [Xanthomonadales bacterium]|nr:hypothetical protein [Xanthomonadales bacterium]